MDITQDKNVRHTSSVFNFKKYLKDQIINILKSPMRFSGAVAPQVTTIKLLQYVLNN